MLDMRDMRAEPKHRNKGEVSPATSYSGAGFLSVTLPGVTNGLRGYIESIRQKELFWIDCWTKPELEAEIRSNPRIATKRRELVTLTLASMEQA